MRVFVLSVTKPLFDGIDDTVAIGVFDDIQKAYSFSDEDMSRYKKLREFNLPRYHLEEFQVNGALVSTNYRETDGSWVSVED